MIDESMMNWQNIRAVLFTCSTMFGITLCVLGPHASYAQVAKQDSLYWVQDSILDQRIDTLGFNTVRKEIVAGIRRAVKFCKKQYNYLQPDSIEHWNQYARWAVILSNKQALKYLNDLLARLKTHELGDGQYYFEFMTLWAAFEARVRGYSIAQRSEVVLSHFNNGTPIENDFYEQRLIDLGAAGIPHILTWAKLHLIPRMDELDKEMLSEADLEFTRAYNRFLMVFSTMIVDETSAQLIRGLRQENNRHVQRFAQDVLESAGYE